MGELHAIQLRAGPFHAGIGGAFTEIDVVFARKTLQIGIGEDRGVSTMPLIIKR